MYVMRNDLINVIYCYRVINQDDYIKEIKVLQNTVSVWKCKYKKAEKKIQELEKQLRKVTSEKSDHTILQQIFTPGQIKLLLNPSKKKINWLSEDIAASISLRSISPRVYRYLRGRGFPLPALSTLTREWARRLHLQEGTLQCVIDLMKIKGKDMPVLDRLTTLSFDEIHISNKVDIDAPAQQIVGPHKTCQVIMARGLCKRWKQPIYYGYDKKMTKEILFEVIKLLYHAGFHVISITCDMGGGNLAFWSSLKIQYNENIFFLHSENKDLKIHVIADVPYLIKLLRNHFLDHGFVHDGTIIDKVCLEMLIKASIGNLKMAFKLTRYHLDVKNTERQRVQSAVEMFSHQVAKAIDWCGSRGFLKGTN